MRIAFALLVIFATSRTGLAQTDRTERRFEPDITPRPGYEVTVPDWAQNRIRKAVAGSARPGVRPGEIVPGSAPASRAEEFDVRIQAVEIDAAGRTKESFCEVRMTMDAPAAVALKCGIENRIQIDAQQFVVPVELNIAASNQFQIRCRYWKESPVRKKELKYEGKLIILEDLPGVIPARGGRSQGTAHVLPVHGCET